MARATFDVRWLRKALKTSAEDFFSEGGTFSEDDTPARRAEWDWISYAQRVAFEHGGGEALRRFRALGLIPAPLAQAA